ncbi:hypothetical protein Tco_0500879 [Tanacetum coccineum]
MPRDCLRIIESKSKVRNSRNKLVVAKVSLSNSTPNISPDVAELKDMVKALLLDKKNQSQAPAPVKAIEKNFVTCGGTHSYRNCPATDGNVYRDNIQEYVSQAAATNFNQGNTGYRAPIANQIRPPGSLPSNTVANPKSNLKAITTRSGISYQGPTIPTTPSSPPKGVERETEVTKDTVPLTYTGSTKDVQPPYLHFDISFADALILMPKFASTLKSLISNKEKLLELVRTTLNEHCSAVLLKKLPEKLGDPKNFSIPCDFSRAQSYLYDLDLADRFDDPTIGIAADVLRKVGNFQFLATLKRITFLFCMEKEAVTFNLDQTSRYSSNYDNNSVNRIDVIDMACEEYSQEVLGFSDVIASGNPTPYYDPIISTFSPTLTPFGDSDFLLEEVDAFLALEDDPTSPEVDDSYYDPEGDILLLENFFCYQ